MKTYIIKFIDSRAYVKDIEDEEYIYTFNINEAKKFSKEEITKIKLPNKLKTTEFDIEKYQALEEKYNIFIKVLSVQSDSEIQASDLEDIKEIEKEDFILNLHGKYLDNSLINELSRLIYAKYNKDEQYKKEYDYDYDAQFEIVRKAFIDKYIDKEKLKDISEEIEEI